MELFTIHSSDLAYQIHLVAQRYVLVIYLALEYYSIED